MGMYDYVGGRQIKIFYRPIFDNCNMSTWHSGGSLKGYADDEPLPLKTLYYKYPQNFSVFDYRYERETPESDVWVIKEGCFDKFSAADKMVSEDIGEAVFDYYGLQLKVKLPEDFVAIQNEYQEARKTYSNGESEILGGRNIFDVIREDVIKYEEEYSPEIEMLTKSTYGKFNEKWYLEDKFRLEKKFGEFLDRYLFYRRQYSDVCNQIQSGASRSAIKKYIEKNEDIVTKYLKWHGGKATKRLLDVIIKELEV